MMLNWTTWRRQITSAAVCGVLLLSGALQASAGDGEDSAAYRVWTSTSGSTVDARLVFYYGDWVRLAKQDGAHLVIKTAFLSPEDREFLKQSKVLTPADGPLHVPAKPERLDINTASFDELKFLPRIGPVLAQRIIKGRPYRRVADLWQIEGIGPKTYDGIKDEVTAIRPEKTRSDDE